MYSGTCGAGAVGLDVKAEGAAEKSRERELRAERRPVGEDDAEAGPPVVVVAVGPPW